VAFEPNDDLQRAKEALTVLQLWEYAGLPLPDTGRDGKYKSPFRDERTPSFSISAGGKVWCDFGGGPGAKGGVWEFAERVWPGLDGGEIAKKLIAASGIVPTQRKEKAPPAAGAAPAAVDPLLQRAALELERKRKLREAAERIREARNKVLARPEKKPARPWPAAVKARWDEGVAFLRDNDKRVAAIAAERGWPAAWARQLVEWDLLSYPLERRFDAGDARGRRQKAFRVDAPIYTGSHASAKLDPVGYHQRFFVPARDREPALKGWLFMPSVPKYRPQSQYERDLAAYGALHGSILPSPAALTPPLPFVLGDLERAQLIVLLEGQWDAATFFGACGWFYDDDTVEPVPEKGVAVLGIRGVAGIDAFLAHWWPYLEANKPLCWVIADNDAAGATWREAAPAEEGEQRPPGLSDRMKAAGCRDVVTSWLKRGQWGKDFNDYYRACAAAKRAPGPREMAVWFRRAGIMDEHGRLAA
jgi:hypothetical protein